MASYSNNPDIPMQLGHEEISQDDNSNRFQPSVTDVEITSTAASSSSKRHRSWVWEFFTENTLEKKHRCKLCKASISAAQSNTSGMASHLRRKHPSIVNPTQAILEESFKVIEVS
jgi:BED zinc finger